MRTPNDPPKICPRTIRRIVSRVGGWFPFRCYVWGKLRTDPAYPATLQILTANPMPVLDIGCGLGLLEFFLREGGFSHPILGIDMDARKIARASRVATRHYPDLEFRVLGMDEPLPHAGVVVMLDVLHYLPPEARDEFLVRIAGLVPPNGIVIIRNASRDRSWRYWITYAEEIWVRATRWIPARGSIHFPSTEEIARPFRELGFREEIRPLWGRTPFNSRLFVFSRAGATSPAEPVLAEA